MLFTKIVRLENGSGTKTLMPILKDIKKQYQTKRIIIDANHYLFKYADEITDDINNVFNLNIGQKIMTLGEMKKIFGIVKKC